MSVDSRPAASDASAPRAWVPDVLAGFEQSTLEGGRADDAPVPSVLVRRCDGVASRTAVLYVHGFVDYFFQSHLARAHEELGLRFYALDLRRHGRALRAHQRPNFTTDLDEYLEDVDLALTELFGREGVERVVLNGHSTGGLVVALYAHRGRQREHVGGVVLNSPFLDMNLPAWQQRWIEPVLAGLGAWWPHLRLPGLGSVYGQSLHRQYHGSWDYNLDWKPIDGFTVFAGWFRAIHRAHREVAQGLRIECPCLVLHAQRSLRCRAWSPQTMVADVVLNVADIERLAPRLGPRVEIVAVADAIHDVMLSAPAVRQTAWRQVHDWLVRHLRND